MATTQQYFTMKGDFFIKERGVAGFPHYLGNIADANLGMTIESVSLQSTGNESGELASEEVSRTATFAMTMNSITASNLAIQLYGSVQAQEAVTAQAFALPALKAGEMFRLGHVKVSNVEIGALVDGVDYKLHAGSGAIVALKDIVATPSGTYDAGVATAIGVFSGTAKEYEVTYISGKTGKTIVIHRWKPDPAQAINLISNEFAAMEISGPALIDETKPDGPLGRIAVVYSA